MVMPEGEIVEPIGEHMLVDERRADKAVPTWREYAPARKHAAAEAAATEMHAAAVEAATMHTAETAAERHCRRYVDNCRADRCRSKTAKEFAFHHD